MCIGRIITAKSFAAAQKKKIHRMNKWLKKAIFIWANGYLHGKLLLAISAIMYALFWLCRWAAIANFASVARF